MKAVRMLGITRRFGAVTALDQVDLEVESGDIHAVVGENGAGKTTLMRILYGALRPDEGQIEVVGRQAAFASSGEAIAAGIGMVSQHYGIIPELTCLQNLMLGAEAGAVIDDLAAKVRADELATKMGFNFDWHQPASTLTPAASQKLEILKLLWRNSRIMILDEPTAMLSPADGDALFASMRRLADDGATVILVTHRLPEVMGHCRRVTVLRGGRRVADIDVADTSPRELAGLIVGSPAESKPREERVSRPVDGGLEVDRLVVRGERGEDKLKGVTFRARRGEIVGIAGVDGSGQRELFHALVGFRALRTGEIRFDRRDLTRTPVAERIRAGLRVIAEDRHSEGVVEGWSLEQNAALGLQRLSPLSRGPIVDTKARHAWAAQVARKFHTRHGGLNLPMASLSGGNQQRFVAARALEMSPQILLAFQPARGLDLGGTADVYSAIRASVEAGGAAVVVSFDLDELLEHADRILVMNRGRMLEPPPGFEKDRQRIGELMVSGD
jgi:simple sugar transport system ATP-binding protein